MVKAFIAILGQHNAADPEKQDRDAEAQDFLAINPDGLFNLGDFFDIHYLCPTGFDFFC